MAACLWFVYRLEEVQAQAKAKAQLAAQAQIQEEVKKTLELEQAAMRETMKEAIMKERMKTEDERLMAQLYVSVEGHMVQLCVCVCAHRSVY